MGYNLIDSFNPENDKSDQIKDFSKTKVKEDLKVNAK